MSKPNFTPGPWSTTQILMDVEIGAETPNGHLSVCWVHIGQGAELEEVASALRDAHFISALPDFHKALDAIANQGLDAKQCMEVARAALAKVVLA